MPEHVQMPLLAGALHEFALADVLQLLALGARTGDLRIDGGPLGRGSIAFQDGRVIRAANARHEAVTPNDVMALVTTLLNIPAGTWMFHLTSCDVTEERPIAPSASEGVSVAAILMDAVRQRDEHDRVAARPSVFESDVPRVAVDTVYKEEHGPDFGATPRLTAADLHVLTAVDGRRDIRTIATLLRRDPAQVLAAVSTLRAAGVVHPTERAVDMEAVG